MANVTLSLDDELLHEARVKAVRQHTSVNAVIRSFLTNWLREDDERATAVEGVRAAFDASCYRSGGASWTRDELHER